ncbi:hypothetical protein EY643_11695 [Halioglobus maricola]|uniref:Thrombospondin n=2 Tax=Halioglobus maricola TaxID=2601894 RepID=A0A5P9NPW5_9GAMM|nr:hypothetical protein EY643_11695 [Halioglobus maricola]
MVGLVSVEPKSAEEIGTNGTYDDLDVTDKKSPIVGILEKLLADETLLTWYLQEVYQDKAAVDREWELIRQNPLDNVHIKQVLYFRLLEAVIVPEPDRNAEEQALVEAVELYVRERRVAIAQEALKAFYAYEDAKLWRFSQGELPFDSLFKYGIHSRPDFFEIISTQSIELNAAGVLAADAIGQAAVVFTNTQSVNKLLKTTGVVGATNVGSDLLDTPSSKYLDAGVNTLMVLPISYALFSGDYFNAAAAGGQEVGIILAEKTLQTALTKIYTKSALKAAQAAGQLTTQAAINAARLAATRSVTTAMNVVGVAALVAELIITEIVENANMEPKLIAQIDFAKRDVDLAKMVDQEGGTALLHQYWILATQETSVSGGEYWRAQLEVIATAALERARLADFDLETIADKDRDGIPDLLDNCPETPNADQLDDDGDGLGNRCDAIQQISDRDTDGVTDFFDNCPDTPNAEQQDADADGLGDSCDPTVFGDDDDNDGVEFLLDNCPYTANADQLDSDLDGLGDICDAMQYDGDNDGIDDVDDPYPDAVTVMKAVSAGEFSATIETRPGVSSSCSLTSGFVGAADKPQQLEVGIDRQVSFTLHGCDENEAIEVIIDFGVPIPKSAVALKLQSNGWAPFAAEQISDTRIRYLLIDNGPLDTDPTPGAISDPVTVGLMAAGVADGPGVSLPSSAGSMARPVPMMQYWVWLLVLLMLVAVGLTVSRPR